MTEQGVTLEAERDFLLRSLDDLEAERAAGGIDDESYRALHDDYTARAAAVVRALRDGVDARPATPRPSGRRRALTIAGTVLFAVALGVALAAALGARLPGQTASGNSGPDVVTSTSSGPSERRQELEEAVAADPTDATSRVLLARLVEADGDLAGALRLYDEVMALDPQSVEGWAQSGRILYLTVQSGGVPDEQVPGLVEDARARLDRAVELDPEYADARYFRAIVLANEYGDFLTAQSDLQRYLIAAPNGFFVDAVRDLLADVTNALEAPTTVPPGR